MRRLWPRAGPSHLEDDAEASLLEPARAGPVFPHSGILSRIRGESALPCARSSVHVGAVFGELQGASIREEHPGRCQRSVYVLLREIVDRAEVLSVPQAFE